MNTHARTRNGAHVTLLVIPFLIAAIGMTLGSVPAATAQTNPSAVLATQFFGSITGDAAGYQLSVDAVLHTPDGTYVGRAGLAEFRQDLEAAFSNLQFWTQNAAQQGNLVIVSFTLTGINTGAYQGLAANCAGIAVPGVAVLRLDQQTSTVVEQWINFDADAIASQIAAFNQPDSNVRPGCAEYFGL